MAFQSYFDQLPFGGTFDNGMPVFPFGGAYGSFQQPNQQPGPAAPMGAPQPQAQPSAPQNDPYVSPEFQHDGPIDPNAPMAPQGIGTTSGGGSFSGMDSYTPTFGASGDAQFASFPSYGGQSISPGGYNSQDFGATPAQGFGLNLGSLGIGDFSSDIGDRLSSISNSPYLDNNNYTQAGINAVGLLSPFVNMGAGILQGFNLLNPGETTGNALADIGATPGPLQSGTAYLVNQLNQLFGGTAMGRDHTSGGAYDLSGPDPYTGMAENTLQSLAGYGSGPYNPANPWGYDPEIAAQNAAMSHMTLNQIGGSGNGTPDGMPAQQPFDPLYVGNNYALGASFGGGRFEQPNSNPIFEGSWMAPGFGAVDRIQNPNDTN